MHNINGQIHVVLQKLEENNMHRTLVTSLNLQNETTKQNLMINCFYIHPLLPHVWRHLLFLWDAGGINLLVVVVWLAAVVVMKCDDDLTPQL